MTIIRSVLWRLGRAERGVATIEFALLSMFFFAAVMVALDFGVYVQQKMKLGQVVEQGAILAFNTRDSVNATTIQTYVKAAGGLTANPTITCNGGTCAVAASRTSTDYRCINQTTGAIETATYTAGASCSSGGNAGYYLKITATKTYRAIVVPNRFLGGSTMTQSAVVRLS
jgi:Flp pilus assembly protein TadG